MKQFRFGTLILGFCALSVPAQPPDGPPPPRGRFELGRLVPPHARLELGMTKEQEKQLAGLEKEVKERLRKIFTAEQIKKLEILRPPRPGGPGGPPGRPEREPEKKPDPKLEKTGAAGGGIQWFSTLESGLREAARTGQPILLVSAAPHCAGVSGIW